MLELQDERAAQYTIQMYLLPAYRYVADLIHPK
jgi:hypothetical protein